ncbi:MAG: nucleotide sugar dehydrogenase [Alphaproteobacteria bacterium]
MNVHPARIAVIGLGYVGLPLAVALARHFPVVGFDVSRARVEELRHGRDRTNEVAADILKTSALAVTSDAAKLKAADIFIITVPTPVDDHNVPDLGAVEAAARTVGAAIGKGGIVVLESTVYPGVTEAVLGPIVARESGLVCGRDFFLGYSPERVNPGDRKHTIESVTKVVAGQTPEIATRLAQIYGAVTGGNVFVARDIRTAEAAKVIENAQRDINIAFINEITMIFGKLGISVYDVLEAARTKWNFLDFRPGFVGGHCIGVDPFYLAHQAQALGHHPEVILAGRRINDGMGEYVAACLDAELGGKPSRVLVLGLTFKENVPDLRNSKVVDVVEGLTRRGHAVSVHDALADPAEARELYALELLDGLEHAGPFDCVLGAVPHEAYRAFGAADFARLLAPGGIVADVKGMWRHIALPAGLKSWRL